MIERFVANLAEEGQGHSPGLFTLDRSRERASLQKLQFQQPWLFLLLLVQAGVALQCSQIDLHCDRERLEIGYSLASFKVEELEGLLGDRPVANRIEGYLKRSLSLLPLLEARTFEFCLSDGTRCLRLTPQGQSVQAEDLPPQLHLRLQWMPIKFWKIWERDQKRAALLKVIKSRLPFCPVPIWLDGKALDPISPLRSICSELPDAANWCVARAQLTRPGQACGALLSPVLTSPGDLRIFKSAEVWLRTSRAHSPPPWSTAVLLLEGDPPARMVDKVAAQAISNDVLESWIAENRGVLLGLSTCVDETREESSTARLVWADGLAHHQLVGFGQKIQSDWCSLSCPPLRFKRIAMLPWRAGGTCRLYPCCDGVLFEPVALGDGLPGAALVCVRDDWEFDATQTALVLDDVYESEVKRARSLLLETLRNLQEVFTHVSEAAGLGIKAQHLESWGCFFEA